LELVKKKEMSDLFKYSNGVDIIPNEWMTDGKGVKMGNKLYLSTNDYNALKKNLEMQKTRWGRFQLWLKRIMKKFKK
jgi:hypothetical protein